MPSALDLRIEQALAKITGEGGTLPLGTIEINGVTLPTIAVAPPALTYYFDHFCTQHGDAEFLVDGEERLSFARVRELAREVGEALVAGYGIERGDRVGIAMRNAPAWIILYMGILYAGGAATLLNGWWQGGELCDGVEATGTKLVFADPPRAARLHECGRELGFDAVTLDVALPIDVALAPLLAKRPEGGAELPMITGDDLATILFTSGSTGQSKGAFSTHRAVMQATFNYIAQALVMLEIATQDGLKIESQHAMLMTVPLFHVTGEVPMLLVSFAIGRKIVMMPKWNALHAMQLIEREKITGFTGVPLMSFEILTHPDRDKYDLSTVQSFAGGGAPRPPEHVRRLKDEMGGGAPALGYGLTETNGVGCGIFADNYLAKPNSTGPATKPLVELAILDDAGRPLPQGERGEVSIRSVCLFSGYWDNEAATRACMTPDGFFRSGDVGYLDEDGYLFIVDRKKDIIIRGGENISCQEVEAALYEHPAVAEACVFGLPDERLGEMPGAVVHLASGEAASVEALTFFLKERLAPFKVPERIWFAPEPLPRLGTEKIDKVSLRAKYRAIWEDERKAA